MKIKGWTCGKIWLNVRIIIIAVVIKTTDRRVTVYNQGNDCFILYFIVL